MIKINDQLYPFSSFFYFTNNAIPCHIYIYEHKNPTDIADFASQPTLDIHIHTKTFLNSYSCFYSL